MNALEEYGTRELSLNKSARALGVGKPRMRYLLESGLIPGAVQEREGGRWYVPPSGLLHYSRRGLQ